MKYFICILLIAASGCSFKKSQLENQTLKGHEELYSEPEAPKLQELSADEKRIVIASTNDLHGHYAPHTIKFKDEDNKGEQTIRIGGEATLSMYLDTLKNVYKNVVLVDSGDIFSSAKNSSEVSEFYRKMKYDAVTVGLRDFNLKVPAKIGNTSNLLQNFAKSSKTPLLLSNLYELKTARVVEWEGTKSHTIREIDGVKVGIIGLIPDDIVAQTPIDNRVGLFVENMLQSTLRHARLLRSLGAEMIVVLTHQGIDCSSELVSETKLPAMKVNFEPERQNVCDLKNVLGEYLERLPPQLVDVVIGGRNHQKIANYVNGTLVMAGFPDGKSFNYAEFVVNTKTKRIVPEKTKVHQPVLLCHEFFKESKDCFHEDKSVDHKSRIPAKFLGVEFKNTLALNTNETKTEYTSPNLKEISKNLVNFKADLSFAPETSGETQLFVMVMKGRELARVLEVDYNRNRKHHWQPSPFLLKNDELTISIAGMELDLNKDYRILTDLESLQKHHLLVSQVRNHQAESLANHSWVSTEEDSVSSQLAAQAR